MAETLRLKDESDQESHVMFSPKLTHTIATIAVQLSERLHVGDSVPLTLPLIATGLSKIPCIPRMADWGGLMMGVPNREPNTPPLLMVNVPPSMSSIAKLPLFACADHNTVVILGLIRSSARHGVWHYDNDIFTIVYYILNWIF